MSTFNLKSDWPPAGDQPKAIKELLAGLKKGMRAQTLLGVTGSGKTFTMANVIASVGKPTLVIAHNKTLAAQLAQEYKEFFPDNAVHYFVSYYDYYQPEAYMPTTDTYIEKDAQINEEIDRLRHACTQALLTRKDVIIVASVSCIYGLGSPEEYEKVNMKLSAGQKIDRKALMQNLISIHFTRTNADLTPGTFRSIGSLIEIMPVSEKTVWSITLNMQGIESINKVDPISQKIVDTPESIFIFPAKHFITNEAEKTRALKDIKKELDTQLKKFEKEGKLLEAERLKRRTTYDLAMIREVGYCNGIENYSRPMSGRPAGSAPDTLLSYFPKTKDGKPDFLTVIDESHVTIPQIGGMYAGDQSRKKTLVEFGFRLPSAMDNRPLRDSEFHERVGQMIFTSATPSHYEKENSEQVVEQVIRPTGLIDPEITIRPILARPNFATSPSFKKAKGEKQDSMRDKAKGAYEGQIQDFIAETKIAIKKGGRVIATTLTKKMAEDLSEYLKKEGIKAEYMHSDIKTLERIQILTAFRKGTFDCIVGVNLLREGLDLPEVTLIGILDADKEGFLRSESALIQTIGRAARNAEGRVILYAETITGSIERAVGETNRRRAIQVAYNKEHDITPKTIIKEIKDITEHLETEHMKAVKMNLDIDGQIFTKNPQKLLKLKEKEMSKAVKDLDFETAAILRDEIAMLKEQLLK
ncbi:MAG: excinuclease ABC subunit UvrB [Candidatus Pacebacteria bacterium]|jgi:excinuclease ABC subunit B|nr:excinuclease ABC subunit UvrB [Candidatus Paceibacterota bacterium]